MIYDKKINSTLSEHFRVEEFHCHCKREVCHYTLIDHNIVFALESLRLLTKCPLIIASAFRCQLHNIDSTGVPKSKHTIGKAADLLRPEHINWSKFIEMANDCFDVVIPYKKANFIHCHNN